MNRQELGGMNFVTICYTRSYWDGNIPKILVTVSSGRLKKSRYQPRINSWVGFWKILSKRFYHSRRCILDFTPEGSPEISRRIFWAEKFFKQKFWLVVPAEKIWIFCHFSSPKTISINLNDLISFISCSISGSRTKKPAQLKPHENFSCWKRAQLRVWLITWCVVQHLATMHFWSLSSQLIEHSFCHIKF